MIYIFLLEHLTTTNIFSQVVDILTKSTSARDGDSTNVAKFVCYYCEVRNFAERSIYLQLHIKIKNSILRGKNAVA